MRLRKYGVEATIDFTLYEVDGVDLRVDWVPVQVDCEVMKDGSASTMCTNTATDEGATYSIVLTATEMEAARIVLKIVDAATKVFLDHTVVIETYGHPSAQHAMDFDQVMISAVATAALENQYDGTGLLGDSYPLRQDQGASISGGLAVKSNMTSVTVIQGSEQDLANTNVSNDTRWTGDDDGAGAEFIFLCTPADTTANPGDLHFEGYYDEPVGATNGATVYVYNFQTATWDPHVTLTNSTSDEMHDVPLTHANGAPGSGTLETVAYTIGDVLIKFKQDTTETGDACLLIDRMYVGFISSALAAATADKMLAYFQLVTREDAAIQSDRSVELAEINNDEGSGGGDYVPTNDSLQNLYDFAQATNAEVNGINGQAMRGTNLADIPTAIGMATADMDTQLAAAVTATGFAVAGDSMVVSDKTGFALAANGLDLITATEPSGKPTTFPGWIMWLIQRFRRSSKTPTTMLTLTEAGSTVTTQTVTDDGAGTETLGPPT